MKLLKFAIPKRSKKELTEIESWTVSWKVATDLKFASAKDYNKCFINKSEAKVFENQIIESAKFLKTIVLTEIVKN